MIEKFRGDTFMRTVKATHPNKIPYEFKQGDIIKCCFVRNDTNYLEKTQVLETSATEVPITYTKDEMATLEVDTYIFEVEANLDGYVKTYQEKIELDKDYITNE